MKQLLILSTALLSLPLLAGTARMDRSITQHKTFALQNKFDFNCQMNAGSATLIDPYWVITANHVSGSKAEGYTNRVTCSSFKKDASGKFITTHSSTAKTDPNGPWGEYQFADEFYDLSLVRLDTPITHIKPVKLPEQGMFSYDQVYEVNHIGYGNYNGRNGGQKHVKYNEVDRKWLAEYKYEPVILDKQSSLQWLAIAGDSGSGITIEHENQLYLLGEIGIQYAGELGWQDTFEDVISRVDEIKKTMQEHSFSYAHPITLSDYKWTPTTQKSITDLHAFYSYWKAENMDFNGTYWTLDGGIYNTVYATLGDTYTIEAVIPQNPHSSAFDVFVNGHQVAHNLDATQQSLHLRVNPFKQHENYLIVEFVPLVPNKEKLLLDHFIVKRVD